MSSRSSTSTASLTTPSHVAPPTRVLQDARYKLFLRVHSGQELQSATQGTYCKLYLGDTIVASGSKSALLKNGQPTHRIFRTRVGPSAQQAPVVWNEKFEVGVLDPKKEVLSIRVKSQQTNDTIGACAIYLDQLKLDKTVDQRFPLHRAGQFGAGHIRLQLLLSVNQEVAAQEQRAAEREAALRRAAELKTAKPRPSSKASSTLLSDDDGTLSDASLSSTSSDDDVKRRVLKRLKAKKKRRKEKAKRRAMELKRLESKLKALKSKIKALKRKQLDSDSSDSDDSDASSSDASVSSSSSSSSDSDRPRRKRKDTKPPVKTRILTTAELTGNNNNNNNTGRSLTEYVEVANGMVSLYNSIAGNDQSSGGGLVAAVSQLALGQDSGFDVSSVGNLLQAASSVSDLISSASDNL